MERSLLAENMIEIPILLVGDESFEDAVRDVSAYLTERCVRLGIRRIQFVCKEAGRVMEWVMESDPDSCGPGVDVSTKEVCDVAS